MCQNERDQNTSAPTSLLFALFSLIENLVNLRLLWSTQVLEGRAVPSSMTAGSLDGSWQGNPSFVLRLLSLF